MHLRVGSVSAGTHLYVLSAEDPPAILVSRQICSLIPVKPLHRRLVGRSKEVAYAPELVARVLLPELSAVQKASLRRSGRINSISRYEDSDPRARCRLSAAHSLFATHIRRCNATFSVWWLPRPLHSRDGPSMATALSTLCCQHSNAPSVGSGSGAPDLLWAEPVHTRCVTTCGRQSHLETMQSPASWSPGVRSPFALLESHASVATLRRRRQALEGHLGRSRSGGIAAHARQSSTITLPPSSGDLLRGWSMDAGDVRAVSLHGYRQARDSVPPGRGPAPGETAAPAGGQQLRPADRQRPEQRRRPERQRSDQGGLASRASSRAPRSRVAPTRRHGSPARRRRGHSEGDNGAQLTSEQLAASEAGRLQPFYSGRWHGSAGGGSDSLARGRQHGPTRGGTNDRTRSAQADAGLWLSGGSDSSSEGEGHDGDGRRRRLGPGGQSRAHSHPRRHRSAGGGGRR